MSATIFQERLLTRQQAADYLGVQPGTLAVWASTGRYKLPMLKAGRLVRYKRSDLDAFLHGRFREPDLPDMEDIPIPDFMAKL